MTRRGGPIGPPPDMARGLVFHPFTSRRSAGHDRWTGRAHHTNQSLSGRWHGASGRIVVHRLTPKIAKLSPEPSTAEFDSQSDQSIVETTSRLGDSPTCSRHPASITYI